MFFRGYQNCAGAQERRSSEPPEGKGSTRQMHNDFMKSLLTCLPFALLVFLCARLKPAKQYVPEFWMQNEDRQATDMFVFFLIFLEWHPEGAQTCVRATRRSVQSVVNRPFIGDSHIWGRSDGPLSEYACMTLGRCWVQSARGSWIAVCAGSFCHGSEFLLSREKKKGPN